MRPLVQRRLRHGSSGGGKPAETAGFQKAGAEWLHMVDLDGAKTGLGANSHIS